MFGIFIYSRTHNFQVLGDKWRVDEVKTIIVIKTKLLNPDGFYVQFTADQAASLQ